MNELENPMSRQAFSLPDLIEQQYEDLELKARKVLSFEEIFNTQKIVLTGCGDSYAAMCAVRDAFANLTGVPVEVVTTLDFSRFYPETQMGFGSKNPMVIFLSSSGRTARVVEAAERAHKHGCFVIGITENDQSALAKFSDKVLKMAIPEFEEAPGVRSYLAGVMALLLVAIRIGEVRGSYTMDEAMEMRFDIRDRGQALRDSIETMHQQSLQLAEKMQNLECFDFLGAGSDYATAWFGQAKFLEATGPFTTCINSEDWLHMNGFMQHPEKIGTFMVAGKENPAHSRNKEVAKYINELTRPFVIITDGEPTDFSDAKAEYVCYPSAKYSFNDVLINFVPLVLIPSYICELIGEEYGRGTKGKWSYTKDGYCVKNSKIIVL